MHLTTCLHTSDMTRNPDQSMVEAAKCMFFKLLEGANDDLDRAILQPQEDHRAHATGNGSRCSHTKTSSESLCSLTEAATQIPHSHLETENEVLCSGSETMSLSHVPLDHVAEGDFHKQLVLSLPLYRSGEWKYELKTSSLTTTILHLSSLKRNKGQEPQFSDVHWTWIGWFECRQAVSRFDVQTSARRDAELEATSVHAQKFFNVSRFLSNPFIDKYSTLNERQRSETSNSQT